MHFCSDRTLNDRPNAQRKFSADGSDRNLERDITWYGCTVKRKCYSCVSP
ncbi:MULTISPECIES: hypothetical protein [Cyanophyceae]|nr:hypothetical protein [Trichocoleus sp. FACHB-40]MBD2001825.1 hypothetical protein [Trichocoleus sp. FACHB-40]